MSKKTTAGRTLEEIQKQVDKLELQQKKRRGKIKLKKKNLLRKISMSFTIAKNVKRKKQYMTIL